VYITYQSGNLGKLLTKTEYVTVGGELNDYTDLNECRGRLPEGPILGNNVRWNLRRPRRYATQVQEAMSFGHSVADSKDRDVGHVSNVPGTMRSRRAKRVALVSMAVVGLLLGWLGLFQAPCDSSAVAKVDNAPISLPRIPPGTTIADRAPAGWTHLVFKSRSELASGDLDAVPEWSAELTRVLFTAMIARVQLAQAGGGPSYRLDKAAIGLGTRIGEKDVIISSDTQEALGAKLGPIKRIILSRGEDRLKEVRRIAQTDTMIVVDAPQTMLVAGRHKIVVFRYVLLVHPGDGRLATLVWQINLGRGGSYQLEPAGAVVMRPDLLATCGLHVDKREVTAGIPSSLAFATTRLPVGDPIALPLALQAVAGQKELTAPMVRELETAARQAVGYPMP
jgi:hypothetical protein